MFERPSDFSIQHSHGSFILSFKEDGVWREIMGFKSYNDVQAAIEKLTNPEKIKRPIYDGTCECLNKQWRYYEEEQENIVFKVCTICNKPLGMEVLRHFNKDFSLDDFIAGV